MEGGLFYLRNSAGYDLTVSRTSQYYQTENVQRNTYGLPYTHVMLIKFLPKVTSKSALGLEAGKTTLW